MPKESAGILMFRRREGNLQVLLVHPGGPFWQKKDEGAWSIPKGELETGEDALAAAKREFQEELGTVIAGDFLALAPVKQKSGKIVRAWAVEGDCDTASIKCNTFTMEWPPKSGRNLEFPEIDKAEFFDLESAARKINSGQVALLEELKRKLG